MISIDDIIDLAIPFVILIHLVTSPFSKVEESFNLQATRDIIKSGIPLSNTTEVLNAEFDHVSFPGSVPRTFVGALALSILYRTLNSLYSFVETGLGQQIFVRGILGLANGAALISVRRAVDTAYGKIAGRWFVVLQASTFHVMYYASRTLPNSFAMVLTSVALRNFILSNSLPVTSAKTASRRRLTLVLLTVAGVIFRSEIAILLAYETFVLLLQGASLVYEVIPAGLLGAAVAVFTTVTVDSFFWQQFPLWPELVGFYYNTILGKSSDWGTSPFYFYFLNALPRLLLNPLTYLLCIPAAVAAPRYRAISWKILFPHLAFIAVYSLLPHKEWRFIIYSVPAFLAVASAGASSIWVRRKTSIFYRPLALVLVGSTLASFAASFGLLYISSFNYPGGDALERLHSIRSDQATASVYLDNLACQTGVTRFLQTQPLWTYDKTENQTTLHEPLFWQQFDYVITEHPETVIGSWEVIDTVEAIGGVFLRSPPDLKAIPITAPTGSFLNHAQVAYNSFALMMRTRFTKDYWPVVLMLPRLYVLERQPPLVEVQT